MDGKATAPVTFETIHQRLFAIMREKADAGDLNAAKFLETKIGPTSKEANDG